MTDFEKFKEKLASKKKFYSLSIGKKISNKEYDHVRKVRHKFKMKTMKDYHELHLKSCVLLLADIFEKFRNNNSKNYRLCPSHYLNLPGFSWDAMLKKTKVKFKLIIDREMYIFLKKVQTWNFLHFQ